MKILKPGRDQKGWAGEFLCTGEGNGDGGCGALLLVEKADLFRTSSHCRDESTHFVTFACEACQVLTDLSAKDQPSSAVVRRLPGQKEWVREREARAVVIVEAPGDRCAGSRTLRDSDGRDLGRCPGCRACS